MSRLNLAAAGGAPSVTGANLRWVYIVAVVALLALAVAAWLVRQVLAASQGTAKMQEIALAIQEVDVLRGRSKIGLGITSIKVQII